MSADLRDVEGYLGKFEPAPVAAGLDARVRASLARPGVAAARWPRWAAAAVLLVAAGIGVVRLTRPEGGARVVAASGGAPVAAGERLAAGRALETPAGAAVTIELADGSVVEVGGGSRVVLGGARADGPVARLLEGRLRCRVAPARSAFRIETPRGELAAVGTEFQARYTLGGPSGALTAGGEAVAGGPVLAVAVTSGAVELREAGRVTRVEGGRQLVAEAGEPPRVSALTEGAGPEMRKDGSGLPAARAVAALAVSRDGTRIAVAIDNLSGGDLGPDSPDFVGVHVFDLGTAALEGSVRLDGNLASVAWLPDGTLWATEGLSGELRRLDVRKGAIAERRTLAAGAGFSGSSRIAVSPDGSRAVATGFNLSIAVYSLPDWKLLRTLAEPHFMNPTDGTWSPDGRRWIAATLAGEVFAWDAAGGGRESLGPGHAPACSPDGRVWALTADCKAFGPMAPRDGEKRDRWVSDGRPFTVAAFSPDGGRVALGREDGSVLVLDVAGGAEEYRAGHTPAPDALAGVTALAWGPAGAWLAVGRADGSSGLLRPAQND